MTEIADRIREVISQALRAGPLADAIRDVRIEPARDEDDQEFLRISLQITLPNEDVDTELETLLERIEEAVSAVDGRYASVRFLDAA